MTKKIILFGGGRMGARFYQAIVSSGYELVALVDPVQRPYILDSSPELSSRLFENVEDVLDLEADAFVICTTADFHIPIARKLIQAGKRRLIIEKPLSQSAADAFELRTLALSSGARVIVNHGRRYCSNTALVKDLRDTSELGSLRAIFIKSGGGALGCVGTHWIDLCNNLMADAPLSVYAQLSDDQAPNIRGDQFYDPGGNVVMYYPDGRRAVIDSGDDVGILAGADFIFEKGAVQWQVEAESWLLRRRKREDSDKPLHMYGLALETTELETSVPDLIEYAKSALNDAFSDEKPISGLDEACATMSVYSAARASAKKGHPIALPLDDADAEACYQIP